LFCPGTYSTRVKKGTTIGDLKEFLTSTHRGKQILGIAFEDIENDQADGVEEWMGRSLNHPLQVMIPKTVRVILEFRGQQTHMAVSDRISEKDFKNEAKKRLSIPKLTHTTIAAVGLDAWSVRAG
jgi:hypothetical protein